MHFIKKRGIFHLGLWSLAATAQFTLAEDPLPTTIEEVRIWGEQNAQHRNTTPVSILTPDDLVSINVATTEDLVKYEPSLVIRRRFIGDANGTLGIRGSNMFQTARSMVFADGVPLHYLLQSRWNGAPRWTLVSASEIARVEVLYGPFSAEYSGNAMGGVVLIETAIPQEREFHMDASLFSQTFDDYGFDDSVHGYKGFMSYGDTLGDLSFYVSYNRLQNQSQPQSFYYGGGASGIDATPVTGAIAGDDSQGNARLYFGDTGVIDSTTDNVKFKVGYEFGDWVALLNLAYEQRNSVADSPNSYVRDAAGHFVWAGNVVQEGQSFSIPASRLNVSELDRQSLSAGLRLKGDLSENITLEANFSAFDILEDEDRSSTTNPQAVGFTPAGQIADYEDTGWRTAELKLVYDIPGLDSARLATGARFERYEMNFNIYNSDNFRAGTKRGLSNRSGGETSLSALFAQLHWELNPHWHLALGGRYEAWKSRNGYYSNDDAATPAFELEQVPGTEKEKFSPKFSLGYQFTGDWRLDYSLAKAYRFPIVEELFSQYRAYNSISEANPELQPEDGLHHNLMLERTLDQGYIRLNVFQENIDDVIESQSTILPGGVSIRTFIPVDEVETRGVELIANAHDALVENLDIRFNLAYTDAKVARNAPDPSLEGNAYPRMPKWRANLLATYRPTERWTLGGNVQYTSNSFGRLDNTDDASNVYGAQDSYTRIGLKTIYQLNERVSLGAGIDNLTDAIDYVAHPWPGRTFYTNISYDL